ncbi:DUF1622 domain-containing protein [Fortiea sp. LEGE XX443]|uniref:DUF1622 domain-containing protein n=1 Tax=Fortiea sp. LEGE XX443 TaxID=1828611 RepID=UPI00187E15C3|nr:DUF1622 domain-containing protein [Fortiea sp. LEGE XX443]MBE9003743.1 DUF1622 domain-containing protein [Fortiea sp. LEGE XX443]
MKQKSLQESLVESLLPLALIFGLILMLSLNVGETNHSEMSKIPLESLLEFIIGYLAATAEIAAAMVIGIAVIRGILVYVSRNFSRSKQYFDSTELVRLQLGRSLVLGLEFSVASDILRTAVAPTRDHILTLGAIVLLRTLLNYFLEREIQHVEQSYQNAEKHENI